MKIKQDNLRFDLIVFIIVCLVITFLLVGYGVGYQAAIKKTISYCTERISQECLIKRF